MKLNNIFKKKSNAVASVQPLNKAQLEKVIGGIETVVDTTTPPTTTEIAFRPARGEVKAG